MPRSRLDGKRRTELIEAIKLGFNGRELDQALSTHDLDTSDVAEGPHYSARLDSLVSVFERKGMLIELCSVLAEARRKRTDVYAKLSSVIQWLNGADTPFQIVLSSARTDVSWTDSFKRHGGFLKEFETFGVNDFIDTLKRPADRSSSVLHDIGDANLFVAVVSRHYIKYTDPVAEFEWALGRLVPGSDGRPPARRVLALALDEESRNWLLKKKSEKLKPVCRDCVIVEELFTGKAKNSIYLDDGAENEAVVEQIRAAAARLKAHFDGVDVDEPPPPPPEPQPEPPAARPGGVIILGEPSGRSEPAAVEAGDSLENVLAKDNVPCERWPDGWRSTSKPRATIDRRPIFVRTIADPSASSADSADFWLAAELKFAFGYELGDTGENVRSLLNCPRVLWRPKGPDWTSPAKGPVLYSSVAPPSEFGRWLAHLLGIKPVTASRAMVYFEDPTLKGDYENLSRRTQVANALVSAVSSEEPPLHPKPVPFRPGQLVSVINSVGDVPLTVIAAHDLPTQVGSEEDTIGRLRQIDKAIDDALDSKKTADTPLMRVAVLLRNAGLFQGVAFDQQMLSRWHLLRMLQDDNGIYKPDEESVESLRIYAAETARRRLERQAP